jgi:lysozyme
MLDHRLLESVKRHEGFRVRAYQDTESVWTIGYGHNLEANGVPPEYAQHVVIEEEIAERWLRQDLEDAHAEAMLFPEYELLNSRARRNVFVEMVFNLGRPRLKNFRRMLKAIRNGDWKRVAYEMLDSRWRYQVGRRATTLANLMETGKYN